MSLTPTETSGWTTGFGNLFGKEMRSWWRTKRWLVHVVLWQVVITGLILLISLESRNEGTPSSAIANVMEVFFQAGGFFSLIGAILVTQGAIVGERKSGTAAWVLTKPTTRKSFVLSKFVAITISFLFLSLVLTSVSVLIICKVVFGQIPVPAHFLEALGILALHQVFYIAATLMLGTLFNARGPVAGVALGFWLAGNILPNFAPKWLMMGTPWPLAAASASISVWKPLPMPLWIPSLATALLTVIMILVALWRFEREEF